MVIEYLDIYDKDGNYLGKEDRKVVHRDALWHKTVHCWLYDKSGKIYFQIRHDRKTFYTTASGHVAAGEDLKEGFGREVYEELGVKIDYSDAILVCVHPWAMDFTLKDGTLFRDRAFANIFLDEFEGDISEFKFDPEEVDGLVLVDAKEVLELFEGKRNTIVAEIIETKEGKNIIRKEEVGNDQFLINPPETSLSKYGIIVQKVIELTGGKI